MVSILAEQLEEVVYDQQKIFQNKDTGIPRDLDVEKFLKTKQITVISGVRRSGKSTLLLQFAKHFDQYYYINFEDDRLINFRVEDFAQLMLVFKKMFSAKTIFMDEVQNVPGWERFVRRLYEEGYKIFVTGSNAKLLSSELATHLTARYFKIELYPFSFVEFLKFKNISAKASDSDGKANILKNFDYYLQTGGFPEMVKYDDVEFLKRTYEDVIYKDLLVRFKIREVEAFKQLSSYLFSNFTKIVSYNSLKNILGFKSVMSVKNHINHLQESYLLFSIYKYDFSLKKQYTADKKIYVIDNGLRNAVSFSVSEDKGRQLENLVFLELKRRGHEVYFFKDKQECDFIIKEKNKITTAIQVTNVLDEHNEGREMGGLCAALKQFSLKHGIILTKSQEGKVQHPDYDIKLVPVWKWVGERTQ